MDRLTSMAVFVRVVEKGSFVAAAEEMAISPTMVGKHIRALEQRLNAPLLNRTTRRQGLTEAGRVFYERCRRLLADVDAAEASARALLSSPSGLLRISAPVTFGNRVLTPILTEFLQRHPEVEAEVVLSDRKVDLIEEGYEAAFRIGPVADDGLVARALPDYRMTLAASPDYLAQHGEPTRPEQLSAHCCFGFSQWDGNHFWRLLGPPGEISVPVRPRLRMDSGEGVRRAALADFGIALHATLLLDEDIAAGRLVRVLPEYSPLPRPMHLVYLPERRQSAKLEAFIALTVARLWGRV
ncbi:D-malate degradation protein R [Serratia liquefaciens]|jgi:DNA-binding transcriptional LysR family regulator|uniref:LysR family transcriptional regulator n=1 Tax=Serratia liquefaciens TaxID=614 RepID=UPI00096259FE|nr:LysR family transcriptional regulator [Serratia liquefaciens]OKP25074.1 LysR family transcriptional regulator [Serratia liquefaciens]RYM72636.1 LysR family transcriptional regulator [Serratia liquefaciens]CAI2464742.1 D-malate degradation protein R [Serratia liquefaciens]